MPDSLSAVLLMAYGTPTTLDDVGPYFAHIRGGRVPSDEAVAHLRARYAAVGGATPLLEISRDVRDGLETVLGERGERARVYLGMRHWHPYIGDVVRRMHADGVRRVIALALAPHFSRMSIGAYARALEDANAGLPEPLAVTVVERWHDTPEFVAMMSTLVTDALARLPDAARGRVVTVFSAHSLPVRIREWGDPYEAELLASSRAVAERVGLRDWRFAWQSAGGTREPWLGPDILAYLETLAAEGVQHVLQVPIGFVAEHLEVLYDIDMEARAKARELGMTLTRTAMPNASPALLRTLAAVVHRYRP